MKLDMISWNGIDMPGKNIVPFGVGLGISDNPQVQGIIVAITNGGGDKYGGSNLQGAKDNINILSSPICP